MAEETGAVSGAGMVSEAVTEYAVQIDSLRAGYGGNEVLHSISLDVACGSSMVILGANGSGKTTLLRTLAGLLPGEGRIRLLGRDISFMKRREIACSLAMMSQLSPVYFSYSVRETVELGRYARRKSGGSKSRDREVVDACLEMTGLSEIKDRQTASLSGGQLQRVFLARTLAQETPIILLDEPTNHLDFRYQADLADFLSDWRKRTTVLPDGRVVRNTLIGVFHDISLASGIATHLAFMKEGKLLESGPKEKVLSRSALKETYGMDVSEYMGNLWGQFFKIIGDS